jgi:hypothetical protein
MQKQHIRVARLLLSTFLPIPTSKAIHGKKYFHLTKRKRYFHLTYPINLSTINGHPLFQIPLHLGQFIVIQRSIFVRVVSIYDYGTNAISCVGWCVRAYRGGWRKSSTYMENISSSILKPRSVSFPSASYKWSLKSEYGADVSIISCDIPQQVY